MKIFLAGIMQGAHREAVLHEQLEHNWSVKFCSHEIYPDMAAFEAALADGRVRRRIREVLAT